MQSLFRRPSGVYVLRIAVPAALRPVFGKREIIATTGTRELALAKILAGAQAAQWRQRFLDSARLLAGASASTMDFKSILQIVQGSPELLEGGYLPLNAAANATGINTDYLLRAAVNGRLRLYYRAGGVQGHVLPENELEPVDSILGAAGGLVIPSSDQMPSTATIFIATGMLGIPVSDIPDVVTSWNSGETHITLGLFDLPLRQGMVFAPEVPIQIAKADLEVAAGDVEALRIALAARISPDRIEEAKTLRMAAIHGTTKVKPVRTYELLSTALDQYISLRVRRDVTVEGEIKRIRNGCAILIELEGDLPINEITVERLREFRDLRLACVPANENKVRLIHKTTSLRESMDAVRGTDWPIMSTSERDKRMRWICNWFTWLHDQKKIDDNPATALAHESVETAAERRKRMTARRDDEAREPFDNNELGMIFGAKWFKTGRGTLTKQNTYREFMPVYYWLPLLGLLTGGGRIKELAQLYLHDFKQSENDTWFVDFVEDSEDKRLKTAESRRQVPIHPRLIELGLIKWIDALRAAGYTRLFPELKHGGDKGYGKPATKWFTTYMARLDIPRDGRKVFHSFRHTFTNALPEDTPDRIRKQLTGHTRGSDTHDRVYRKDVSPDEALPYVQRLKITLPDIAAFDVKEGLKAVGDALQRKKRGRGASEEAESTS